MPAPVRVVLVGCGWFGCVAHIPALKRLEGEGRIRLVGLCSRSEASIKRASDLYARQDLKHYLSLDDVAEDPGVDLVDLVLPIGAMPDAIRLFLSAGKHVISEKPCAPSVARGMELIEHHARLERPVVWAVAENWRFKKTAQMVEDIVASGVLGEIRFADFTYLSFQKPDNQRWRASPDYGGGHTLDSGVHFVALLRKIVGEIEEVSASVSQRVAYLPPPDSVTAILSNTFIQQQKLAIAELQRQQVQFAEKMGPNHPDMLKLSAAIRSVEIKMRAEVTKVVASLKNDYQASLAQERSLMAALDSQKGSALALPSRHGGGIGLSPPHEPAPGMNELSIE